MSAGVYNFTIEKGTTFRKTITWKDATGNPVPLTGYTAKLELRDQIGGQIYLTLSTNTSGITLNPAFGQLLLYASATDTAAILIRKGVYDLDLTAPNGDVTRLIQGKITISPGVTT